MLDNTELDEDHVKKVKEFINQASIISKNVPRIEYEEKLIFLKVAIFINRMRSRDTKNMIKKNKIWILMKD